MTRLTVSVDSADTYFPAKAADQVDASEAPVVNTDVRDRNAINGGRVTEHVTLLLPDPGDPGGVHKQHGGNILRCQEYNAF